MIDMLKNAKDLIAKGKALNDPELIQMGMELLEQYAPGTPNLNDDTLNGEYPKLESAAPEYEPEPPKEPEYVCDNCGHTMPVDKEGRKRCPECKKHKLQLVTYEPQTTPPTKQRQPSAEELLDALEHQQLQPTPQTNNVDQFKMQIRAPRSNRIHYDENGNPDGVIRRREEVDPSMIHNMWEDEGEDRDDRDNEILKKFTKVSPRTRAKVNYVEVECEICHRVESLHPIHVGGRGRHICVKCITKRSGR